MLVWVCRLCTFLRLCRLRTPMYEYTAEDWVKCKSTSKDMNPNNPTEEPQHPLAEWQPYRMLCRTCSCFPCQLHIHVASHCCAAASSVNHHAVTGCYGLRLSYGVTLSCMHICMVHQGPRHTMWYCGYVKAACCITVHSGLSFSRPACHCSYLPAQLHDSCNMSIASYLCQTGTALTSACPSGCGKNKQLVSRPPLPQQHATILVAHKP